MIRSEQVFSEVKNQKLPLTKTQKINFDNTSNDFFCVLFLNTNLFTVKREIEKVPEVPTLHSFSHMVTVYLKKQIETDQRWRNELVRFIRCSKVQVRDIIRHSQCFISTLESIALQRCLRLL